MPRADTITPQRRERADWLASAIRRNNLTQADFAAAVGVGDRQVRAWCSGEYPVPQHATLIMMAIDQGLLTSEWLSRTLVALV